MQEGEEEAGWAARAAETGKATAGRNANEDPSKGSLRRSGCPGLLGVHVKTLGEITGVSIAAFAWLLLFSNSQ